MGRDQSGNNTGPDYITTSHPTRLTACTDVGHGVGYGGERAHEGSYGSKDTRPTRHGCTPVSCNAQLPVGSCSPPAHGNQGHPVHPSAHASPHAPRPALFRGHRRPRVLRSAGIGQDEETGLEMGGGNERGWSSGPAGILDWLIVVRFRTTGRVINPGCGGKMG